MVLLELQSAQIDDPQIFEGSLMQASQNRVTQWGFYTKSSIK
jgi:hypothetical protein